MRYLLRSMLFVPGYNEKFLEKAATCDADAIILDMEDAVPKTKREEARQILKKCFERNLFKEKQVFLRVNELGTEDLEKDLELVRGKWLCGVVAPKIYNTSDIKTFSDLLEKCEKQEGIKNETVKLLPLIETAEAVLNLQDIAGCSERIIALLFGGEDYLDSISGQHEYPPKAFDVPRAMIAMAARVHGLLPIDTPYLDINDKIGFMEEEGHSYAQGFAGVLLVNPKQISWANQCFSPTEEEVRQAEKILEVVNQVNSQGDSIAMLDGKMIGPPMLKRAQKVIELNHLIKEKGSRKC